MRTKTRKLIKFTPDYVMQQLHQMNAWNKYMKPGDTVKLDKIGVLRIKGKAFMLGGHTGYVAFTGRVSAMPLNKIIKDIR